MDSPPPRGDVPPSPQPQDLQAIWQELGQLREASIWQAALEQERGERVKEGGKLLSAQSVLKKHVEELGKESAKQLDSIQELCAVVNTLSMMLSKEQQETFQKAQEFLVASKQAVEKVRRQGQQHKSFTSELLAAITSLSEELSSASLSEEEEGKGRTAEQSAEMAKKHLEELESRYEKQRRASEDLVTGFSHVVNSLESEQPGNVCGAEELDGTVSSFFEMHVKLQKDAKAGKGTTSVIDALKKATGSGEEAVRDGDGEWWLLVANQGIEEARQECERHRESADVLVHAINLMKFSLNEKLQEKVIKGGADKTRGKENGHSSRGQSLGSSTRSSKTQADDDGTLTEVHLVDNHVLNAPSPGLGYRNSPTLSDMDQEKSMVPWGSLVCGSSVSNDEWLQVGERFLPKKLDGVLVLRPYIQGQDAEMLRRSSGGSTARERSRSKGRQAAVTAPLLDPIPEGSASASEPSPLRPARVAEDEVLLDSISELQSGEEKTQQVSASVIGSIMETLKEHIREEVATCCSELRAPGGPLASEASRLAPDSRSLSSEVPPKIALDEQVKEHIEEVARKFVDELWQGSISLSRGSGKENAADEWKTTSRGSGKEVSVDEWKTSPLAKGGSLTTPAAPGVAGPNFVWRPDADLRSRPNSMSLANARKPSGSPDRISCISANAPPSSPDRINTPFSMDVRRPAPNGQPGPARATPLGVPQSLLSPSPSPTQSARGRRLSDRPARPIVPVARPVKPYPGLEAMQRSGSGPAAATSSLSGSLSARPGRNISTSPGPGVSPSPVGTPRNHMRTSPPPAAHRLNPSHMPFGAGPLGISSRKTCPPRTTSPESYLEFDSSGRPLASILSV